MKVFVVYSQWDGPRAVFYTREEAFAYTDRVSGGTLMQVRELTLEKKS